MSEVYQGGCLCGAVRFSAKGAPNWVAHCHCADCRGVTGAPFTTFAGYDEDAVSFEAEDQSPAELKTHLSSPGSRRQFCADCGTPLSYASQRWPGEIHLYLASFDTPDVFTPTRHGYLDHKLQWFSLTDNLPGSARFSDDPE
jgi:hypothetical protein